MRIRLTKEGNLSKFVKREKYKGKISNRALILARVIDRDGNQCRECGSADNLTLDHIMPASKGGTSEISNLQLLCADCNNKKADLLPTDYEYPTSGEWVPNRMIFPPNPQKQPERDAPAE